MFFLKDKRWLLTVSNRSAIIWVLCIAGVIGVLTLATKFGTHDPGFSPGYPEEQYLLPMLSFLFVGSFTFFLMIITGGLSFFMQGEKEYKPLWKLSFKKIFLFAGILFFGVFSFLFAFGQSRKSLYDNPTYTGQDIFNAVNAERKKNGLNSLVEDPILCDNLVQRYLDLTNPDKQYEGHAGFERWIKKEEITGYALAEIYTKNSGTTDAAIKFWEGSPGHRLALLGDYDRGCAYANNGTAVVILGKK